MNGTVVETVAAHNGDWVEIEIVLLEAGHRSEAVPADTSSVPYIARVKGFLVGDAMVGDHTAVETVVGRTVEGTMININPPYGHDFGRPVPELLPIGIELRSLLAGEGAP